MTLYLLILSILVAGPAALTRSRMVFAVVSAAFFVRLGFALLAGVADDEVVYEQFAEIFLGDARRNGVWTALLRQHYWMNNFLVVPAALYSILWPDLYITRAFVAAVGSINVLLTWHLARRLFPASGAPPALALAVAFWPDAIEFSAMATRDTLLGCLLLISLIGSLSIRSGARIGGIAGNAFAMAATFLFRPIQAVALGIAQSITFFHQRLFVGLAIPLLILAGGTVACYVHFGVHLHNFLLRQFLGIEWDRGQGSGKSDTSGERNLPPTAPTSDDVSIRFVRSMPPGLDGAASFSINLLRPSPAGVLVQPSWSRLFQSIKGLGWYMLLPLILAGIPGLVRQGKQIAWPVLVLCFAFVAWAFLPQAILRDPTRLRLQALPLYLLVGWLGLQAIRDSQQARRAVVVGYSFLGVLTTIYLVVKLT